MSDEITRLFATYSKIIVGNQISEQQLALKRLEKAVKRVFAEQMELAVNTAPAGESMPVGEFFNENNGE